MLGQRLDRGLVARRNPDRDRDQAERALALALGRLALGGGHMENPSLAASLL